MDEYKIKISKLNGLGTSYEDVKLSIVEQKELSSFLSVFFSVALNKDKN